MRNTLILALLALSAFGADRKKIGEPGKFDYYLLALSWSPAYCETTGDGRNDAQCAPGRKFSFVLHGLWPQYKERTEGSFWPQFCSEEKGLKDPKTMLDIMPSVGLIRHEWDKHGTCTALGPDGYFQLARKAFHSMKVPAQFQAPKDYQNVAPSEVKQAFLDANPGLKPAAITIGCSSNFLSEVRICLDKDLKPVPCTGQRDCKAPKVRVPPVR